MKKILLFSFLLFTAVVYSQQKNSSDTVIENANNHKTVNSHSTFQTDHKPEFPGGDEKLIEFISKNLKYPKEARKDKIEGKVYVKFAVRETGRIDSISVYKGVREDIDQAAKDIFKKMPKWSPGIKYGKPVRVWYILPITFTLD
jgi:periplasmic protein TonB